MGRRLRALCGELDAPGRDEIGELDGKIEQLMRTIASPTAAGAGAPGDVGAAGGYIDCSCCCSCCC